VGTTLKPALFCPGVVAFLGTNPACVRRFSTLQSAHAPVGGHCERFFDAVELAVVVAAVGTVATGVWVSDALPLSRDEPQAREVSIEKQEIAAIDRVIGQVCESQ
jgi:hypothetical protein